MISVRFQGKPFCITANQVNAQPAEEAEDEDLQDLLELTPQKDVLFRNAKVGSQEIPGERK